MLRTMIAEAAFEQRWTIQGRLVGQYALDLKQHWEQNRTRCSSRKCVVDLEDVASVDSIGESVLAQMAADGAEFIASRCYMKSILAGLQLLCK
jgi:ABC-type transporter Mla MlaB component